MTLRNGQFSHLGFLRQLRIPVTPLYNMTAHTFMGAGRLREINLQGCNLVLVPSNLFYPCKCLHHIKLDSNKLKHLSLHSMNVQASLSYLSIRKNKLAWISRSALSGYQLTGCLSLSKNDLVQLPPFASEVRLQQFNIHDNKVSMYQDGNSIAWGREGLERGACWVLSEGNRGEDGFAS